MMHLYDNIYTLLIYITVEFTWSGPPNQMQISGNEAADLLARRAINNYLPTDNPNLLADVQYKIPLK